MIQKADDSSAFFYAKNDTFENMANKTIPTEQSAHDFIQSLENEKRKEASLLLFKMMQEISGEPPVMWGDSIVGFGQYHYKYESGREGDFFLIGFSPRKTNMVVYIMPGFEKFQDLLDKLGPYKTGSSCLYLSNFDKIDQSVLKELIERSYTYMNQKYN